MRKSSFFLICLLVGSLLSAGCYYQKPDCSDEWDLTEKRKDSLDFEASHHYNRNYNFVVVGDSLCLQTVHPVHNPVHAGVPEDTVAVFADDRLVVAEVMIVPEDSVDSVWVKVARDQSTMGWVHEQDLLARVVPDDSISRFIHAFSNTHLIYFLSVLGVLSVLWLVRRMRRKRFHIVHFDDIGSCYPTLLCLTLSGARLSICVLACKGMGGRSSSSKAMSCTMSASTPARYNAHTNLSVSGSSSSFNIVLTVTYTLTRNVWAYSTTRAMSSTELPADALAPKREAPIYTASAPWSTAAMAHSTLRAGARSSTGLCLIIGYY